MMQNVLWNQIQDSHGISSIPHEEDPFHQQIGLKFRMKLVKLEHNFEWY